MTGLTVTLNTSGGTEVLDWAMLTNTLNSVPSTVTLAVNLRHSMLH
jgi:hypothetical protein